jgi:hypothetical protein
MTARGTPHLITSTLVKYLGDQAAGPFDLVEQDRMAEAALGLAAARTKRPSTGGGSSR